MKYADLKKLPKDEFTKKMDELRMELMKLSAQVAIGTTPKSTKQIRELKRTIAKSETLKREQLTEKLKKISVRKTKYINH